MCNIMIDLETLGTRPGCVILSIAAVPFATPFDIESFYVRISEPSWYLYPGFHVDQATLEWWSKQNAEARKEAFGGTDDCKSALYSFAECCRALPTAPVVWGNGASFDLTILSEAYKLLGMRPPWKYTDERCYRTLKALYPQIPYLEPQVKHNALQDASAQAQHAARIFSWIGEKGR